MQLWYFGRRVGLKWGRMVTRYGHLDMFAGHRRVFLWDGWRCVCRVSRVSNVGLRTYARGRSIRGMEGLGRSGDGARRRCGNAPKIPTKGAVLPQRVAHVGRMQALSNSRSYLHLTLHTGYSTYKTVQNMSSVFKLSAQPIADPN